ncbi:STAS domain-containing protein [Motiliproteus sp. MSK22-1]|uniref:STAS domain-containing protein n=1 Tax=Motiliproteus sp. MSK22-1 TaxID=1897630 RepID=UPI0009787CAA|nr:STAS domain-containing protein [Motiliproteus sp. MSK22-1]OMH32211.1 hypothetical protein BGP75_15675 [Motiliproteus sp. MSK22-1]
MPVQVSPMDTKDQSIVVSVSGRFDYSVHKEFRNSYIDVNARSYRVDLSKAEYMDSSALGMLLLLKEHADKSSATINICHPQPMVRKVLEIANFNRFFKIS